MKKNIKKAICLSVVPGILASSMLIFSPNQSVDAKTYRMDYNIYGDFNKDKRVDVYDLILMRKKIIAGEYDKLLDLNVDQKLNENDLEILKNFTLGVGEIYAPFLQDDADEDGICDMLEINKYNTDPDNADTDNDNLDDFIEIKYGFSSPTNANSIDSKINDGDFDSDADGYTNTEEIKLKTSPLNDDTDFDNLKDKEETEKYKTDPINPDSDEDNVVDGDEIMLNLNPLNNSTDGAIKDNEVTTEQVIAADSEVMYSVNNGISPYSVSMDINAAGYAQNVITATPSKYREILKSPVIVGTPIDIIYDENLKFDSATIKFDFSSKARSTSIDVEKYMIFKFIAESHAFVPLETLYDGLNVYAKDSEVGTYCVVDVEEYEKIAEETGLFKDLNRESHEILFMIDLSTSLEDKLDKTKETIFDFCDVLFATTENSKVSFMGYAGVSTNVSFTSLVTFTKLNEINNFVENLSNTSIVGSNSMLALAQADNLTNPSNSVFSEECEHKYIFVINDSTYNNTDRIFNYSIITDNRSDFVKSMKSIKEGNISLNFILSRESYDGRYSDDLKQKCKELEVGLYSRSMFNDFTYGAYQSVFGEDLKDKLVLATGIPYVLDDINKNKFISGLPVGTDISKLPASDNNGNINFKDACRLISPYGLDKDGNSIWPSYYEICEKNLETAKGLIQFDGKIKIDGKLPLGVLPISSVVLSLKEEEDVIEGSEFEYAYTSIGGNKYYYPKTYYDDLYTARGHMEKINGEYDENGKWIDWR